MIRKIVGRTVRKKAAKSKEEMYEEDKKKEIKF